MDTSKNVWLQYELQQITNRQMFSVACNAELQYLMVSAAMGIVHMGVQLSNF